MGAAGRAARRAGENPLHAAQRELYEEAHCKAETWRVLVDFYSSPGGTDEALRLFLATDLAESAQERYEAQGEELEIQTAQVPLARLVELILAGELHNPTLITGTLALHAALTGAGPAALRPADAPGRPGPSPLLRSCADSLVRVIFRRELTHRLVRLGDLPLGHTDVRSARCSQRTTLR